MEHFSRSGSHSEHMDQTLTSSNIDDVEAYTNLKGC